MQTPPVDPERSARRQAVVLWLLIAAGFGVRVVLAWTTRGTNDVGIWEGLARHMRELGVAGTYAQVALMNHPPPVAYYDLLSSYAAGALPFHFLIKLPGLLGEALTAWVLFRRWREVRGRAYALGVVALFSWSLCSILLSGFHGNTDALYAALCLLAAFWVDRQRLGAGGLALAGALSVKLIPLIAAPALAFRARSGRELGRITAAAAVALVPWIPFVILAPQGVRRNVLQYASNTDHWGVPGLLMALTSVGPISAWAQGALELYLAAGKYLLLAGLILAAVLWRQRPGWSAYDAVAMAMGVFLVFAPGFGVQYTVMIVPVLFAVSPRRAITYATVAGLFVGVTYLFWLVPGSAPPQAELRGRLPHVSAMLGVLTWAVLVAFVTRGLGRRPAPAAQGPT